MDGFLMASVLHSEVKKQTLISSLPSYVGKADFNTFMKAVEPTVNENIGYMFFRLDKEWYTPGELIEGRLYLEFFIPSFQTKLVVKLEAIEKFPKHHYDTILE
jgi:hypothetical protein